MINFIVGDITKITKGTICQQVNCMNAYGRGVSGAISRKWPQVEIAYREFCEQFSPNRTNPRNLFSRIQEIYIDDDLTVANIFSQLKYGNPARTGEKYTDMKTLTVALYDICERADEEHPVYVPDHIGCALGGGNWKEFLDIMSHENLTVVCLDANLKKENEKFMHEIDYENVEADLEEDSDDSDFDYDYDDFEL